MKHFALNNQETRRLDVDVDVDERALREIYLPAFEAAVKRGQSQGTYGSIQQAFVVSTAAITSICYRIFCVRNGI